MTDKQPFNLKAAISRLESEVDKAKGEIKHQVDMLVHELDNERARKLN